MKVARGTVVYALLAHICFGVSNFMIGYMNDVSDDDDDSWISIGVLWATGVIGIVPSIYYLWTKGTLFFAADEPKKNNEEPVKVASDKDLEKAQSEKAKPSPTAVVLTTKVKVITISTGVFHALGEYLMKAAFARAPSELGPLSAFVSSEAIVVSLFCHFVWKERMNFRQGLCVTSIAIGLSLIGLGSVRSGQLEEDSLREKVMAFVFAFGGMLCFAAVILGIRIGVVDGIASTSGVLVRLLTESAMGSVAIVSSILDRGIPQVPWLFWLYPITSGFLQALGIIFVIRALKYPNTGIANAIYSSNSVVVLIMSVVVTRVLPGGLSLIGMAIVVSAVAGLSFV